MHLSAALCCLPAFAAAGLYNYLKSAYFYIQQMNHLCTAHPEVFQKFENGFHVIRRSSHSGLVSGQSCHRTDIDDIIKDHRWFDTRKRGV